MTFSRREFLGTVGLATAWTITAKAEPERSANNIVRIGVIGMGVRGKFEKQFANLGIRPGAASFGTFFFTV